MIYAGSFFMFVAFMAIDECVIFFVVKYWLLA
jgi:hypothetical protein